MDADLISKKELLELTGISYGQLYRWKRKNLLPEEWFIRKSTFTGQETFFPRDKMLARIERIMRMKDDLSLDEIADQFSPNPDWHLPGEELVTRNIVTERVWELYQRCFPQSTSLAFAEVLAVYVLDQLLRGGDVNLQEGEMVVQTMVAHAADFANQPADLVIGRKLGISWCALVSADAQLIFDNDTKVILRLGLAEYVEELKLKVP
ncbi:MAG: YhbD family protein [Alicyclobacillus sp.]|nr:YhbD family protein [Alicyclobacillus sp.]